MTFFHCDAAKFYTRVALWAFTTLVLWVCPLIPQTSAFPQSNAITISRNLGELVGESQTIVQGWVTTVTMEPHPQLKNLMTVVVTLQVEETLKGAGASTFTFRQAVIDKQDQQQNIGYRTGQHLLLVLIKPSQYGLTSPAGMEQGRFRIESQGVGKLSATNGLGNAGLFRGLDSQLQAKGLRVTPESQDLIAKPSAGPISLEQLKTLIRTIAAADTTK